MTQALRQVTDVYALLRERLGVDRVSIRIGDATDIDLVDKVIVRNDPSRVALVIINLGADVAYVRPQVAATSSAGIRLSASGGNIVLDWQADFALPSFEWHGVGAVDNLNIFVLEVLIG